MHRIILDIEDSAFSSVNYLIQSLSSNDVHIISDEPVTQSIDREKVKREKSNGFFEEGAFPGDPLRPGGRWRDGAVGYDE